MKIAKPYFYLFLFFLLMGQSQARAQDIAQNDSVFRYKPNPNFNLYKGTRAYRTWAVSAHGGALAPVTVARGNDDFSNWSATVGYGLSVRKQLAHTFGLELNLMRGKLAGSNKDQPGGLANGYRDFETEFWAGSLMGVMNVGTIDFLKRENWINFLVKAGYGQMAYAYTLTADVGGVDVVTNYKGTYGASGDQKYLYEQFIPVGVGVKFKISDHLNFDLGYTMNFMGTDDLDGVVVKKTSQDKFSYTYAGVEFSIGKYKKQTLDWVNPAAIMYDDLYMRNDSAELAALKKRMTHAEKEIELLKCDSDGDGVGDLFDKCPTTPFGVAVSGSGCPLDSDQDSVYDYLDKCPLQKGTKANNGCPEIEKPAVVSRPVVQLTPEEQKILQDVFEDLEFASGKSVIKAVSFPSLNKLATLLVTKRSYSLKISGHTDDVGSDKTNQTLSVNRANAVKNYLIKKGVSKNRLEARGYGESQPVADNSTEEGRQKNRRVEFTIF